MAEQISLYTLIYEYEKANYPYAHFFDKKTLKFFGERLSEMYVLKDTVKVDGVECYVVSGLQRVPQWNGGVKKQRVHHYFSVDGFKHIG